MMYECKVCANADNEYCFACENGNQFKPMTNAARLRAMSDEELAKWLSCPGRKKDMFPDLEIYIAPSADEWLDWLEQEAR